MKKLMFGLAIAAVGTAFAVESSNIVGYNTLTTDGTRSPLIGLSFTPVSGGSFTLGDFKPVDGTMNADDDMLQEIDSTSLETANLYQYLDKTTADAIAEEEGEDPGAFDSWIGWWDARIGIGEEDASADDVELSNGFGFMGLFDAYSPISFQSAGAAPTTTTSITTDGTRSPIIVNYIPRTIKLKELVPVDGTMNADDDMLQEIDSTTLETANLYQYLDKSTADAIAEEEGEDPGAFDSWIGWWDARIGIGEDGASANDIEVAAGTGFMGLFDAGGEIQFQLPSSTAVAE